MAKRKLRYRSLSRKVYKQIARLDGKSLRQFYDILQSHVAFTTLDPADVIPVQSGPFRQFFLGIAPFFAELPQP